MPPPGRPLTSMTTGPSSVSLISVCRQPMVTPSARAAVSGDAENVGLELGRERTSACSNRSPGTANGTAFGH